MDTKTETKTPAEIWGDLSEHMRSALVYAELFARDREYIGAGRWRDKAGSPKMRRATGAHSTLRALQRRGLVCQVERLGAAGDANASAKGILTAKGLRVECWYWQDERCIEPIGPFGSEAEAHEDYRNAHGRKAGAR